MKITFDEDLEISVEMSADDFVNELKEVAERLAKRKSADRSVTDSNFIDSERLKESAKYFEFVIPYLSERLVGLVKASREVIKHHEAGSLGGPDDSNAINQLKGLLAELGKPRE